ncbi:hypothetical protein ACJX0J_016062, partial [Zea mays]
SFSSYLCGHLFGVIKYQYAHSLLINEQTDDDRFLCLGYLLVVPIYITQYNMDNKHLFAEKRKCILPLRVFSVCARYHHTLAENSVFMLQQIHVGSHVKRIHDYANNDIVCFPPALFPASIINTRIHGDCTAEVQLFPTLSTILLCVYELNQLMLRLAANF